MEYNLPNHVQIKKSGDFKGKQSPKPSKSGQLSLCMVYPPFFIG